MKLRRTLKFHSLRKNKIRMTWNKYNLFNLSRLRFPDFIKSTYFQQKWKAKALTRAYHGEHIKEQKWQRMFDRRLRSVVDMNPKYMALNDGAEQATGRGSGRDMIRPEDVTPWKERYQEAMSDSSVQSAKQRQRAESQERQFTVRGGLGDVVPPLVDTTEVEHGMDLEERLAQTNRQENEEPTPYMNMSYAPIERRIDVAIFRALFASSTRQARNLVIHGKVKINGQPMNHATYLLNPGDMFQVDPDAVMQATGMPKTKRINQPRASGMKKSRKNKKNPEEEEEAASETDERPTEPAEEGAEGAEKKATTDQVSPENTPESIPKSLQFLARNVRKRLDVDSSNMSVKKKQEMRRFMKIARELSAKFGRKDGGQAVTSDIATMISDTLKKMSIEDPTLIGRAEQTGAFAPKQIADAKEAVEPEAKAPAPPPAAQPYHLSEEEEARLAEAAREYEENPVDPSKPYKTPWEPKPYMSPFAFIPRYLEVNQNICAAVYLRHPVARPGMAEVPSPFPPPLQALAFNWYLRRR